MQLASLGFSSFSKGLFAVSSVALEELTLSIDKVLQAKLNKRTLKFQQSLISLDGVSGVYSIEKAGQLIVKIEDLAQSRLGQLKVGSAVCIGLLSCNPHKWLLSLNPIGQVRCIQQSLAEGHKYTQSFHFECAKRLFKALSKENTSD